jgi:putative addiction module killer protein
MGRVHTRIGSTASTRKRRYRIYLAKDGESLIVLFGGGTKRRQQPDIDRAKALHAEYKARKLTQRVGGNAKKRKR